MDFREIKSLASQAMRLESGLVKLNRLCGQIDNVLDELDGRDENIGITGLYADVSRRVKVQLDHTIELIRVELDRR